MTKTNEVVIYGSEGRYQVEVIVPGDSINHNYSNFELDGHYIIMHSNRPLITAIATGVPHEVRSPIGVEHSLEKANKRTYEEARKMAKGISDIFKIPTIIDKTDFVKPGLEKEVVNA